MKPSNVETINLPRQARDRRHREKAEKKEAFFCAGKPIWSSESYTTYSDSNGGGCWARAINWGWVKGNLTRHMAWNLIQSYPTDGSGMNYNGHGLTWCGKRAPFEPC